MFSDRRMYLLKLKMNACACLVLEEEETNEHTTKKNDQPAIYLSKAQTPVYITYQVFLLPEKKEVSDHTLSRGYTKRNKRNEKQKRSLVKKTCFFFFEYEKQSLQKKEREKSD